MEIDYSVVNEWFYQCLIFSYVGNNCEQNIDECASFPCRNNGTCFDNYGSFTCQCINGFIGVFCEMVFIHNVY